MARAGLKICNGQPPVIPHGLCIYNVPLPRSLCFHPGPEGKGEGGLRKDPLQWGGIREDREDIHEGHPLLLMPQHHWIVPLHRIRTVLSIDVHRKEEGRRPIGVHVR